MKHAIVCIVLSTLVVSVCSCDDSTPQPSVLNTQAAPFNSAAIITIGNHSYLPINKEGQPSEMVSEILQIISSFETAHPELVVENWSVEKRQSAHVVTPKVYGLWINHHKRAEANSK